MHWNEVASLLSFDINSLWRHIYVWWDLRAIRERRCIQCNNVSSSDPNDKQSWNNRLIYDLKSIPSVFKLHQKSAFGALNAVPVFGN